MARRPSLALLIIVAGAFFLIGLYTAFLQGNPAEPNPSRPTQPRTAATIAPKQTERTLLVVGVDDLSRPDPELRAIWLLSFRPPSKDLFLLGIPLDLTIPGDPPAPIQEHFSFNQGQGPSETFLEALYRGVPLEANATITLDEAGFAQAIDYLGGVRINDATFSGQEVLGILSMTEGDASASLSLQRRLLNAMSQRAAEVGASPEITPLIELIPDHLHLSTSVNDMVAMMAPALPIQAATTHIELY
ncbi:MAG: hypothetical protein ACLFWD_14095 [Anaerolineales bacterium]